MENRKCPNVYISIQYIMSTEQESKPSPAKPFCPEEPKSSTESESTEKPIVLEEVRLLEKKQEEEEKPSLKSTLKTMVDNPDGKIKVTPLIKSMVVLLSNIRSETLEKIEILIQKIMEDKKVDIKDVPAIILLLENLYKIYMELEMRDVSAEDCATLLKIVSVGMYNYKFQDKFTEEERESILEGFNLIIDTSVTLIDLKETIPKPRCFSKCVPFWCKK
mgnify:FL=1|jgi:hypothetical protein